MYYQSYELVSALLPADGNNDALVEGLFIAALNKSMHSPWRMDLSTVLLGTVFFEYNATVHIKHLGFEWKLIRAQRDVNQIWLHFAAQAWS